MNIPLYLSDIVFAAFVAGIIVFIIRIFGKMFHMLTTRNTILSIGSRNLTLKQLDVMMQRCRRMFPIESFVWEGITFNRGSNIRVITNKDETFEGQLMGINNENMICLVTSDYIIAQQMNAIIKIHEI
ncbi:MAG: hypothetical protein FWE05_05315 [Defluviitaleaceae bacterium]|nr:hypothetical protein [Defluviitaleaceae bacterium]